MGVLKKEIFTTLKRIAMWFWLWNLIPRACVVGGFGIKFHKSGSIPSRNLIPKALAYIPQTGCLFLGCLLIILISVLVSIFFRVVAILFQGFIFSKRITFSPFISCPLILLPFFIIVDAILMLAIISFTG